MNINYAINRFLNICVNRSISKESILVMIVITFVSNSSFDKIQSNALSKIKNVVIIIVKMCIICEKRYHTTNEHREQFNLNFKRDRDQFDEERDDRDSKHKRRNDNDDDERLNSKIDDEEKKHKIYIVISFETLTIMSAMSRHVAY
jgi:ABC-type nickel/cobalt efflux system permease component RcnA